MAFRHIPGTFRPSPSAQLAIELFDLKDTPDGDADSPKCARGPEVKDHRGETDSLIRVILKTWYWGLAKALCGAEAMGCLGGVPVHNGQIVDHAMPTGFRYKLWLLAASMGEWTDALPEKGRHCLEFDFEYSAKFEAKLTPFEVGPSAWMCEFARLPKRIVQSPNKLSTEKAMGREYCASLGVGVSSCRLPWLEFCSNGFAKFSLGLECASVVLIRW
ncbi:unnamed protein product [Effrenium voratum]|nr:unnamed protein product [Effrenium voratum]